MKHRVAPDQPSPAEAAARAVRSSCAWLALAAGLVAASPAHALADARAATHATEEPAAKQGDSAKQDPGAKTDGTKETPAPVERLKEWPKPADKDVVMNDIERVVKAHIPEMADGGRAGLLAAGAAAAPFVLDRYARERDEEARKRLFDILVTVTNETHTRLLAKQFGDKLVLARTFALWRAAAFPDPELKKDAEAAWARVSKQGDKADPDERYAAALCCASAGSTVGLEALWDATRTPKEWDKKHAEMRVALAGSRGKEATTFVLGKLGDAPDRKTKVAVLRMLAGCGERVASSRVKPFLDDDDNQVRIAAINALRGMIDNDPPLDNLSSFEAIELAGKWKGRS